jgi:DNA-binding transcriptional ArsR family regulator
MSENFDYTDQATFLHVIANPRRLEILSVISKKEVSVSALSKQLNLSQSALSQHLSKLRIHKLVTTRRNSQTIYYSCSNNGVGMILSCLDEIFKQ